MSKYEHLTDHELKEKLFEKETFLRSHMSESEYISFVENLEKNKIKIVPISEQKKSGIFTLDLDFPPTFLVIICKIIKPIISILGFMFMVGGGLYSLFAAYTIWTACTSSGWQGIISKYTLHIVLYFVILFLINHVRYLVYKITE